MSLLHCRQILYPLSHQGSPVYVVPFCSCPQSFPASGSFQMSQLFTSGGQSIGVSASTSILPMSTQDCSPLGWTGWISLQSKGLSRVFSNTTVQKHARVTAGPKRPHLGVCPGPNIPLQGRQGSRGCIPGAPGESGLVSRGSQGLRSPLESRRGSLGAP